MRSDEDDVGYQVDRMETKLPRRGRGNFYDNTEC